MQPDVEADNGIRNKDRFNFSKFFPLMILIVVFLWVSYLIILLFRTNLKIEGGIEFLIEVLTPGLILPTILASLTLFLVLRTTNEERLKKRRFGGYWKYSITENRFGKWLIKRRWFQFLIEIPGLVFIGVIIFGIFGYGGYLKLINPAYASATQDAGLKNAASFLTWNLWWPGIIILFLVASRFWCTMCPLGCVGEWAHRTHMPKKTSRKKIIIRISVALFLGITSALILGVTLGLFGGIPVETIMGSGQLSHDMSKGILDYLAFLALVPINMLSAVFSTIFNGDLVLGLFWLASIAFGFIVGGLFGYLLPEFGKAMVSGTPMRQKEDPKRPYPKKLRSMWITTGLFAGIMLFDFIIGMFVNPLYTALFLAALVALSIILGLIYERRAFCMYVCPLGGLIGSYGMTSILEIRNKDLEVCKNCKGKYCTRGRTDTEALGKDGILTIPTWDPGYACPMGEFPMVMDRNLDCILCTECFKSCPYDNISLNIRAPLVDTYNPKRRRFDQAGLSAVLVGLTLAVILPSIPIISKTLQAIIDRMTEITNESTSTLLIEIGWFIFAAILLPIGSFFILIMFSKYIGDLKGKTTKDLFNLFSFAILPLGLSLHFAFWIIRIFEHLPHALVVLADPFYNEFMGNGIYIEGTTQIFIDDPVTFPVALFYLINPLFYFGIHNMEIGDVAPIEFTFAVRIMVILLGMIGSIFAANRTIAVNLKFDKSKTLKILIPVVVWIVFFTFLGLYAVSNQI